MGDPEIRSLMAASIFPAFYSRMAATYGDSQAAREGAVNAARKVAHAILAAEQKAAVDALATSNPERE